MNIKFSCPNITFDLLTGGGLQRRYDVSEPNTVGVTQDEFDAFERVVSTAHTGPYSAEDWTKMSSFLGFVLSQWKEIKDDTI